MGSGSINAYAILESRYRDDLTLLEAKQLAIDAIKSGILNDLSSGSNVDLAILQEGKTDYFRNYEIVGKKEIPKPNPYVFIPDNIEILKKEVLVFDE